MWTRKCELLDATVQRVDACFLISERGSTVKTEVTAGAMNFLANIYLLVILPQVSSLW